MAAAVNLRRITTIWPGDVALPSTKTRQLPTDPRVVSRKRVPRTTAYSAPSPRGWEHALPAELIHRNGHISVEVDDLASTMVLACARHRTRDAVALERDDVAGL